MGRKSSDSSSSSSSSSDSSHKKHKVKKDKKKEDKSHQPAGHTHPIHGIRALSTPQFPPNIHSSSSHTMAGFPSPEHESSHSAGSPPEYQAPPPSGYRVPLSTDQPFPTNLQDIGQPPPFHDLDGVSPIYIGSALMPNSVQPCKIGPHLHPFASVPYGGGEHGHNGRYDLLPFRPLEMEWVLTSHGRIPYNRRPVEGGYEENGARLYHAAAVINSIRVPGKAGEHLGGCRIPFGGREHEISHEYEILCWKEF